MQLSPIFLVLAAAAAIAAPAPIGELAERTPEALVDVEGRGGPDWKRGSPDWKRGNPDWKRGAPDWKHD